jgi:hypothetical protein
VGFRARSGPRLFEIFDPKLNLLDQQLAAFGGLPELLAPRLGQVQLQPLDLQPADGDFALRQSQLLALRKDYRSEGRLLDAISAHVVDRG